MRAVVATAVVAAALITVADAGQDRDVAGGAAGCSRFAAPDGSNYGPGTRARPFRTPQRLVDALQPGQTGCLRGGNYRGRLKIQRGGTERRPISLRSHPGEAARLIGRVVVTRRAAHVVVRDLYLDGRNARGLPSPTVNGRDVRFVGNDVTNRHTAICFVLGHPRYGRARDVVLRGNRIHDCGRLPATNHDHGVYVSVARDTRVLGNWIYANADRGVQFYADAQRTHMRGNVIEANGQGVIFGGDTEVASSQNVVEHNVIANSVLRHNVESYFPFGGPIAEGNQVRQNCIGGGARGSGNGGIASPVGFSAEDNLLAAPNYRAPSRRDYRVVPGTPCAAVFQGAGGARPGPAHRAPPLPERLR